MPLTNQYLKQNVAIFCSVLTGTGFGVKLVTADSRKLKVKQMKYVTTSCHLLPWRNSHRQNYLQTSHLPNSSRHSKQKIKQSKQRERKQLTSCWRKRSSTSSAFPRRFSSGVTSYSLWIKMKNEIRCKHSCPSHSRHKYLPALVRRWSE